MNEKNGTYINLYPPEMCVFHFHSSIDHRNSENKTTASIFLIKVCGTDNYSCTFALCMAAASFVVMACMYSETCVVM